MSPHQSYFKEPKKPKPKWRRPIKVKSERRYSENEYRASIRQQVFDRDGGCVIAGEPGVGECFGPDTPHHILKAGQQGPYTLDNLVTLCARHNNWVESNKEHATRLGLYRSPYGEAS